MAFLVVKEANVQKEGESDFINKSGIYTVTLNHCEIATTTNKAVQANYFFNKVYSYGNTIIGTSGQQTFGYGIMEALAAVLGEEVLSDAEMTTVKFKNSTKELPCIPELNDVEVRVWIQFKYRMYQGSIREDVSVRRFYRAADGASGSEVLSGQNIGERLEKDQAFADEIKYEDGATPELVEAWIKAKQEASKSGAAAPAANSASASGFPAPKKKAGAGFPGAK